MTNETSTTSGTVSGRSGCRSRSSGIGHWSFIGHWNRSLVIGHFLLLFLLFFTVQPARAVQPFLIGFPSFVTVDAGVDSQGFTYLLAESGAIKKIDQSGLEIGGTNWLGDVTRVQTISFFFFSFIDNATSLNVDSSHGVIYVTTLFGQIFRIDLQTGVLLGTWSASISTNLRSSIRRGNDLYACGVYYGSTMAGGLTNFDVGSAIILKIPADFTSGSTYTAVRTFGYPGVTTANSIVLDDSGNVYVGGNLGNNNGGRNLAGQGFVSLDFNAEGNQGYIAKWDANLSTALDIYVPQTVDNYGTYGGEVYELAYGGGFVYAVDHWTDVSDVRDVHPTGTHYELFSPGDRSMQGGQGNPDIEVLKLDTSLRLDARATVKSPADIYGRSLTVDNSGNVYFLGTFGPGIAYLIGPSDRALDAANAGSYFDSPDPSRWGTISASASSMFVAKLDSHMNFEWVQTPTGQDLQLQTGRVRWNARTQRLAWVGYETGTFTIGNPGAQLDPPLAGYNGFMGVFEADGSVTEQVKLDVFSEFGDPGQVLPFGGSTAPGPSEVIGINSKPIIKGSIVTVSVPKVLYRNLSGADNTAAVLGDADAIDAQAETRITSTGYSVNDNVATGDASSYTFTADTDTKVTFSWVVEYALRIKSDLRNTAGTGSLDGTIPGIPGLTSLASGNPLPEVQKHWVKRNESVIAEIDGQLLDLSTYPGLPVKYLVLGYNASGRPNNFAPDDPTQSHAIFFPRPQTRQHVPEFVMAGPATIEYFWKLKIGIEASTTTASASLLPLVHVVQDPGGAGQTPQQSNGLGVGTYFFDEHTKLDVGTLQKDGLVELSGWFNGDGTIIPLNGNEADVPSRFTLTDTNGNTNTYLSFPITDLVRPTKIMWNYGARNLGETVEIGNSVTFSNVEPQILSRIRTDLAPASVDIILSPDGSSADDMGIWDDVTKRWFPLRPGTVRLYWRTTDPDPNSRIITVVSVIYPSQPHFHHIANTPPVNLDPDPNDMLVFQALKYTENNALVDGSKNFTANNPGNTVLLFNEVSSSGRGGQIVALRVRVVSTRLYDSDGPPSAQAVIGQKITSSYDTAGLDSGFTFNEVARYNPFIYDRQNLKGPIIPVNLHPTSGKSERLVVVWYERRDQIVWPYQAVQYTPRWPTANEGLDRIVIASRFGNESVASNGTDQVVADAETHYVRDQNGVIVDSISLPQETTFNPTRFQQPSIYSQPDRTKAGYNPNEEHGVIAPSLRSAAVSPRPNAVYALRVGDLNVTSQNASYTSDPYVLAQYFDAADGEFKMKVYSVTNQDANFQLGELSYNYTFQQEMRAGEPVIPFYPLVQVIGATPCAGTYGRDGAPSQQVTYWRDHKDTAWAISGDGFFFMYFFYPLQPDFWWPPNSPFPKQAGDCVAWLPNLPTYAGYAQTNFTINADGSAFDYRRNDQSPPFQGVRYTTTWPENVAVLKVGETLTFPGGEFHADNPTTTVSTDNGGVRTVNTEGLPGVLAWASGEVVFDSWNPTNGTFNVLSNWTARLFPALEERTVSLPIEQFPTALQPASQRTKVNNGRFQFIELSASLQKRFFYDPITTQLGIKGFLNDKAIGDPTLTADPPAVYILEPNILTAEEHDALVNLQSDSTDWVNAVNALFNLSRNPSALDINGDSRPDDAYYVGLEPKAARDSSFALVDSIRVNVLGGLQAAVQALGFSAHDIGVLFGGHLALINQPARLQALGPGLALVANPDFLDPLKPAPGVSYITLAENNNPSLGSSPVVLHIIKVDRTQRYRGAIKTVLSDNVFDENIILRHTGDFGANADDLVFEWWYRAEDGTSAHPPDIEPQRWKLFGDPSGRRGQGFYQLTLKGNPSAPEVLLADTLFFVRYRHKNDPHNGTDWSSLPPNLRQWAGAGNSTPQDLDQDGFPDYKPQLAEGWVKRVLDAVNPYEARINDFTGDNPATYSSMIRELGARFEGPVALNPAKNVIENVGLIALYETIFERARGLSIDLSTPISTPGISTALQLASTRLADFYTLLGNEAYTDALNPTIGIGSETGNDLSGSNVGYGNLAPAVFCFENQVSSLLEEELALLRGQDDNKARPVYNRLFWNFTKGEGEAAYAVNYNIFDVNIDGFIDEDDAMILYPQGHGDAWGHYLTAIKHQYDLLRNPYFNWVSRSELYNLQDIVIPVDFLDERKFAQVAAAKAKVGAEVVSLTYRSKYVEDPDGQWQGYLDTDSHRAWGVDEWAKRAGQGAYFDWVTANALLPAHHPNTNLTGIQKIDRTTVQDLATISGNLVGIQEKVDQINEGNNPLGLENGALTFDIDPTFLYVGSTAQIGTRAVQGLLHFDQIFERALQALKNAKAVFNYANEANNMLRQVANNEQDFRRQVFDQDLSYRNQLIEIFGSPYQGTIGSGKAFPPGYIGPDTMLYMYVNVRDISDSTVPLPTGAFTNLYLDALGSGSGLTASGFIRIDNSWRKDFTTSLGGANRADFYNDFIGNGQVANLLTPDNLSVALTNLDLPILAAGYTFQAPPEWGIRSSPGELQSGINEMLQAQADLAEEISNYGSWYSMVIRTIRLINAKYQLRQDFLGYMSGNIGFNVGAFAVQEIAKKIAEAIDTAGETVQEIALTGITAVPTDEPIVGLADGPGDILSVLRGSIKATTIPVSLGTRVAKLGLEVLADTAEFSRDISDKTTDLLKDQDEKALDIKQSLLELQNELNNENTRRIEIFKKEQALRDASEKYRATLAKGLRLIQERRAYNQKVAAMTQTRRYQDMTFRISRNAALEKYRSAFDLAAEYTYLAASAYDYDTNLGQDDAGSPVDIRADIVRQRTLGILNDDGQPASGAGGLAEDLAWLKGNYDALKFRMGLNNPQLESTTFSLRSEAFRTLDGPISDDKWRQMLSNYPVYRTNLWTVPEFRAYCRPFAPETNGAQPGLVIEFSSQIRPNKNFFGWPLGGGDNAYDPSVFATKIVQAGVWFLACSNCLDSFPLTPHVYLIPVGQDIMTVPTSQNLDVRIWHVLDQAIPVPFVSISSHLDDPAWKPLTDSLSGPLRQTKRFSSFLGTSFDHEDLSSDESAGIPLDYRLVGRSAWNTRWLLIIPGATMNADPTVGLQNFISNVTDIKLILNTYGSSGN